MNLPILTEKLVLRDFRDHDLDTFLAYRNDPAVARFQDWETISRDEAEQFLRKHAQSDTTTLGQWQQIGIALNPVDILVGDIGLCVREDFRSAELGFTVAAEYQRQGLAQEAMTGLIDALFERSELEWLDAAIDSRNLPAGKLLTRLGFEIRSTVEVVFKGVRCQEQTYTLRRQDWRYI